MLNFNLLLVSMIFSIALPIIGAALCVFLYITVPSVLRKAKKSYKQQMATLEESETHDLGLARADLDKQMRTIIVKDAHINKTLLLTLGGGLIPSMANYESKEARKEELKALRKEIKEVRQQVEAYLEQYRATQSTSLKEGTETPTASETTNESTSIAPKV